MTSEALLFLDVCLFNKTSMASNNSGACNHSVYESSKGSAFFVAVNTQIQFFTGQFYLNKCQCLKHLFYCRLCWCLEQNMSEHLACWNPVFRHCRDLSRGRSFSQLFLTPWKIATIQKRSTATFSCFSMFNCVQVWVHCALRFFVDSMFDLLLVWE